MIGLIVSNIVLFLVIMGVSYYVVSSHNKLADEIKSLRNDYSMSIHEVLGEMQDTEGDLYDKMVEQERAYYTQLLKQSDDLNFAFSNQASGISSSVSQLQQSISQTTSQQQILTQAIQAQQAQQEMLTKSVQSQQEMLTQSQLAQQTEQEMVLQSLQAQQALISQTLEAQYAQQEMLTQSLQSQQEMLYGLSLQQPQQEWATLQETIPTQETITTQETSQEMTITQEIPYQADDLLKRANLMAIAYYNAFRDRTPNEVLQWDYINKHYYIVGFQNQLYKNGQMMVSIFTEIYLMPYNGKYKVSDVVNFLVQYLDWAFNSMYKKGPIEVEKELNNGETFHPLATTFGALPPDANFFPHYPHYPDNASGPNFGSKYLFDIKTEDSYARLWLDAAMQSVPIS